MNKTTKIRKGHYHILFNSDHSQTGWEVQQSSEGWDLIDFDGNIAGTYKTKNIAVRNFYDEN